MWNSLDSQGVFRWTCHHWSSSVSVSDVCWALPGSGSSVIFLKYKPLRYRVICSVIVWVAGLLSCGFNIMTLLLFLYNLYFAFFFVQFFLFLSFQLFFCLAVLRALKQSGPGERGREKEKENHMKRRAFYLILITNVILIILYAPYIIFAAPQWISANNTHKLLSISYVFFTLTSLVQPLLFSTGLGNYPSSNVNKCVHCKHSVIHLL